jgi:hypothetical protein
MCGEVTHPFQAGSDRERAGEQPQVAGDGLLGGEQGEHEFLDPGAADVQFGVAANDVFGQGPVSVGEGGGSAGHRSAGQVRQLIQRLPHPLEVSVVLGTDLHRRNLSSVPVCQSKPTGGVAWGAALAKTSPCSCGTTHDPSSCTEHRRHQ